MAAAREQPDRRRKRNRLANPARLEETIALPVAAFQLAASR
jgi:hypothetical protein